MDIVYETNGKGFLGWIVQHPGAFLRGGTAAEARGKLEKEMEDYGSWLNLLIENRAIDTETIFDSLLAIEDADSDILLSRDLEDYESMDAFQEDCGLALLSAEKARGVYESCTHKKVTDRTMVRKTFYGDVYSTIGRQYLHIVNVQDYYLWQIDARADIETDLATGRANTIEALQAKILQEGNKYHKKEEEGWTVRKVIRRLIWHDRIHSRAIARMEERLQREYGSKTG